MRLILFNVPLLIIFIVILAIAIRELTGGVKKVIESTRYTVSSDGHIVDPEQDLTCETKYGHDHGKAAPRFIVHQDAEAGYVVLNGVKRKISDCKNL